MASRIVSLFFLLLLWWKSACSVEITWTPAETETPEYSMEERQMLLQLDHQISSSPDPQTTLEQVATSNGIDANQLAEILMENRQFIQQHQGAGGMMNPGGARTPLTVRVVNALTSALSLIYQQSMKHPGVSSFLILTLFLSAYVAWNAPRNGVLIGGNRGPTTLFVPPTSFVESTMLEPEWWQSEYGASISAETLSEDSIGVWRQIEIAEKKKQKKRQGKKKLSQQSEKVEWYADFPPIKHQTSQLSKAAITERVVDLAGNLKGDLQEGEDDDTNFQDTYNDLIQEQVERLLISRPQLTEFVSNGKVRFFTSHDEDPNFAALMVPGLGKWGRIGYIPLAIQQTDGDEKLDSKQTVIASVILSPLKETFWEGNELHIRFVRQDSRGMQSLILVQVALTLSQDKNRGKSRPLPKALANRLVESICSSLQSSLETRTEQAWVRRAQSTRFASRAKLSAKERRETRASRERQIEEMAADRRRRRFSQNPNQGRYRPSGERMRSPNNAVYK